MREESTPLIYPTTAGGSARFALGQGEVPARLAAAGLAGAESATLSSVEGKEPGIPVGVFNADGDQVALVATGPSVAILAPGIYEVTLGATAGAAGVYLARGIG